MFLNEYMDNPDSRKGDVLVLSLSVGPTSPLEQHEGGETKSADSSACFLIQPHRGTTILICNPDLIASMADRMQVSYFS